MSIKIVLGTILIILLCCNIFLTLTLAHHHQHHKHNRQGLRVGFYNNKCPQAERIVKEVVRKAIYENPGIAAGLIRLYFHDCFVKGCDASILLDSTPSEEPTEKTSPGNIGVRGFEVIDAAKIQLEEECPETVSCADTIAFAIRDAVALSGQPLYPVPAGRRDGLTSLASNVFSNLTLPDADVEQMEEIFTKKDLTKKDLVVLLGAHSIGVAPCFLLEKHFYNFNSTHEVNPKLDQFYVKYLRSVCPRSGTVAGAAAKEAILPLNTVMPTTLSNIFYVNVINGRAVIPADQSLLDDAITKELVSKYVKKSVIWAKMFRKAMVKLGHVDVLTGEHGEIRRSCRVVNKKRNEHS